LLCCIFHLLVVEVLILLKVTLKNMPKFCDDIFMCFMFLDIILHYFTDLQVKFSLLFCIVKPV
jgi:hypothetical protein